MSRWAKLWGAVRKWWKNEPPKPNEVLESALELLMQYDQLYGQRITKHLDQEDKTGKMGRLPTMDLALVRDQAASAMWDERADKKRRVCIESEVRVLALAVARIQRYLEGQHG